MGLACSQIMLLSLTARKADCEYGISVNASRKMALTREMSELSSEYYSKLKSKQYAYYANGHYNKLDYNYLMGGMNYKNIVQDSNLLKKEKNMVLTDYKGQVVLSKTYSDAITKVMGNSILNASGTGQTFPLNKIPEMMAAIEHSGISANQYRTVMNGGKVDSSIATSVIITLTGSATGESRDVDNSEYATELIQKVIDFYEPIFKAAAVNGWTTEYKAEIAPESKNEDYIGDALASGIFQLAMVNSDGHYVEDTSMTYFVTAGHIDLNNSSETREEVTAWYNAEKERITEKENYLDISTSDLSTELEAINTEIQSIQSFIDDAISSVFDWGSS